MTTILVTGGAGFIGSALVRLLIEETTARVVNVDALTYAGNLDSVADVALDSRYTFAQDDICDPDAIRALLEYHRPDAVIHLAAESHVDRSIDGPAAFVRTNVVGTFTMLQEALRFWRGLDDAARAAFRFVHVSTDEVYGSLDEGMPPFTERTPYAPNSPYSASKAGSDHLVRAWFHTYGLPTIITNCSNNYGPRQFPEKLIPLTILNAISGQPLPVYGKGTNVRDWLYVDDHARALQLVLERGTPGRTYVIGARSERRNIDIVHRICDILDTLRPSAEGSYRRLVSFVTDRPGHDLRYAIDPSLIEGELGWSPRETLESGLEHTVRWYLDNVEWVSRVRSGAYRGERLGLGASEGA